MVADTWIKKLDISEFMDVSLLATRGEPIPDGWETEDGNLIRRDVNFVKDGNRYQHNCNVWVDNNSEGLFYSEATYTEGGTPIIHKDDKYRITFWFQLKSDADRFVEIANDDVAKKLMWSGSHIDGI